MRGHSLGDRDAHRAMKRAIESNGSVRNWRTPANLKRPAAVQRVAGDPIRVGDQLVGLPWSDEMASVQVRVAAQAGLKRMDQQKPGRTNRRLQLLDEVPSDWLMAPAAGLHGHRSAIGSPRLATHSRETGWINGFAQREFESVDSKGHVLWRRPGPARGPVCGSNWAWILVKIEKQARKTLLAIFSTANILQVGNERGLFRVRSPQMWQPNRPRRFQGDWPTPA